MMQIRKIQATDYESVALLIRQVFTGSHFGYNHEAEIVEAIRELPTYQAELEQVAVINGQVVGHGILSEVTVYCQPERVCGLVLGPIAVITDYQGQGIGSQLIASIEKAALALNYHFISILGDPQFYSRFGYFPAEKVGILPPFEVRSEYFMVKELVEGAFEEVSGILHYSEPFNREWDR